MAEQSEYLKLISQRRWAVAKCVGYGVGAKGALIITSYAATFSGMVGILGALGGSESTMNTSLALGAAGTLAGLGLTGFCCVRSFQRGRQAWQITKNINLLISQKLKPE